MRRYPGRRGLLIAGVVVAGLVVSITLGVVFLYPYAGAWALRHRVLPRVAKRLERTIDVDSIVVHRGHAILDGLRVTGPDDAEALPLVTVDQVVVEFDFWASLTGEARLFSVAVAGPRVNAVRHEDGRDNFRDVARRFGLLPGAGPDEGQGTSLSSSGLRPELLVVSDGSLSFQDHLGDVTAEVADIDTAIEPGKPLDVTMSDVVVRAGFGPSARARSLRFTADPDDMIATGRVEIDGADLVAHRAISLSSITGHISSSDERDKLIIDLAGSYGGASERLWTATGWVAPSRASGSVHVEADRFTFDRLDSILRDSMVIDYDKTAVSAEMDIDVGGGEVGFRGNFELTDATVFHPMLAEKPVQDIDIRGNLAARLELAGRVLTVEKADLRIREVDYQLDGFVRMPGGIDPGTGERRAHHHVAAHLVIPPLPCQKMLRGIPTAMASYLQGYELTGTFDTDVRLEIDWADLQKTTLDGGVGIFRCKVIKEPEPEDDTGVLRLLEPFTHYVELEVDKWMDFLIGDENPDFVPIWDISLHLVNSLMTTEDSRFYDHRGFITREFRTALIKNLEAGYFRYGASSITMQTVKNVLLYREKTLSRKLQELFLTWHIENRLDKDRIFEIYLNAIEYGPGLYGIGPAARHYFGKHPRDLNPAEAAFFSSILPSPKRRYKQYCDNKLSRWTRNKISRVLETMYRRERLTTEEYEAAKAIELVFDRAEAPERRECRRMVQQAIENARPTNPMKK